VKRKKDNILISCIVMVIVTLYMKMFIIDCK
jgi:hypothetical protein